jgi:hypothetical protein
MSTLKEYNTEMSNLYTALSKAHTQAERKTLSDKAYGVMCDLETDYGVPAFSAAVPTETQKMFFALQDLLNKKL